jgi:hypothetical protein
LEAIAANRFQLLVFGLDVIPAIAAFQPADGEVAPGHVLKMTDEERVDESAPEGADDGDPFRRRLFRESQPEPLRYAEDQSRHGRRAVPAQSPFGDMAGRLI